MIPITSVQRDHDPNHPNPPSEITYPPHLPHPLDAWTLGLKKMLVAHRSPAEELADRIQLWDGENLNPELGASIWQVWHDQAVQA